MLAFLDDPTASPPIEDIIKKLLSVEQSGTNSANAQQKGCGQVGHAGNCGCKTKSKLHHWIYKHFDKIGCMIVLKSGEGPLLPWEADLIIPPSRVIITSQIPANPSTAIIHAVAQNVDQIPDPFPNGLPAPTSLGQVVAHLNRDGRIVAKKGYVMACNSYWRCLVA